VYPTEKSKRLISDLQTVGLVLTRDQAVHLARVLLAAAQDWNKIDVTAYRFGKRKTDGTYQITVTSSADAQDDDLQEGTVATLDAV
jgi:hypothetical protein